MAAEEKRQEDGLDDTADVVVQISSDDTNTATNTATVQDVQYFAVMVSY